MRSRVFVCILVLLLVAKNTSSQVDTSKAELLNVVKTATERIAQSPNSAFYYGARGEAYYGLGELGKALVDLNKAIQLDGSNWEFYYDKGIVLYDMERPKAAIDEYSKAIALDDQKSEAYSGRAASYYRIGKYAKAINDYTRSIDLNKLNPATYYNRALCYSCLKDYSSAVYDYTIAINYSPDISMFYCKRGYARFEMDSIDAAVGDLKKSIELDSRNIYGYYYLSLVYRKIGETDDFYYNYDKAKKNGLPKYLYIKDKHEQ